MSYIITANHLTKQYKKTTALYNATIHIPQGSVYGLIGNNGAGKTTLMRLLLGLQEPTSGRITMDVNVRTGAILEYPALYPYWSAKKNLKYQLSLAGTSRYNADELLHIVGLNGIVKPVFQLSLGMRQRLGLAMALVGDPDLLFWDEPLNGLDPFGMLQILDLIMNLNHRENITFVISSHNLNELQKIATHIGFLRNGCIIHECSMCEITFESLEEYYFKKMEDCDNETDFES